MSRSLHWRPVPPPPVDNQLDTGLMFKLESYLFHDHWEYNIPYEIDPAKDHGLIGYLRGLADGGVEGADELLGLIGKHGKIQIWAGDGDGPR